VHLSGATHSPLSTVVDFGTSLDACFVRGLHLLDTVDPEMDIYSFEKASFA
jgi:hypothetical protein